MGTKDIIDKILDIDAGANNDENEEETCQEGKKCQPNSKGSGLNNIVHVFQNLQVIEFFKTLISSLTQSPNRLSSASPLGTSVSSDLNQNIAEGSGPQSQVTQAQTRTSSSGRLDLFKEMRIIFATLTIWKT